MTAEALLDLIERDDAHPRWSCPGRPHGELRRAARGRRASGAGARRGRRRARATRSR